MILKVKCSGLSAETEENFIWKMDHSLFSLPDELCCSICTEIFKEPVILKCNHSFCGSCLQDCWKNKSPRECPECKQKCSKDEPILNQRLKEVADLFLQKNDQSEIQNESFCSLHVEKFLSFCEEDQDVICLVCVNSIKHRDHHHSPVEKALQNKKEELKAILNPMKEDVKKLTEAKKEYDKTISQIKIQARDTEKQIKEEYERIYQFLRDEEKSRLIALREEEEENTQRVMEMMDNISKHISTLSDKIESTERRLMEDDITFLKTYKDTKERLDFKLQDPELLSGVPIDANKHLEPLKLRVKKIMEHILSLPDLTTALNTGDEQQPSDNTETPGHLGFVLASEGFTSGKHSWEVEVGDSPSWAVGVLEEPINKERKITFRPDSGFWALMLKNGEYQAGYSRLEVKKKPEKIGVELDYDNRQVSFFNSTDKSCIISLENKCSEKLFPFVCPWITGTEQNHEGLQISILKVKFLTEKIWSFLNIPWPKLPSINTTSKPAPVKVHIAVSGPALNSHQTFMKKLDMSLEECSLENCSVILVFCPVVTQMWTDMDTGVKNVPDDKPIILVLLHYSYNPDHIDDIPITPPRSNVVKVVQCVFHETVGLLECELNERAVRAVRAELKRLQTASVVARHVGGTLAPPPSQTHP
uniref:Tripartite motif-containing protein 35-like n=1 Tax=Scleropages formosus TaxID=113540 RepID=A0A8C9TV99_SCLFO